MIHYEGHGVQLHHGDCLDVLRTLPDASVDAVVTDPPYGLEFMGKDWDAPWNAHDFGAWEGKGFNALPSWGVSRNPTCRTCGLRERGAKKCECAVPVWDQTKQATARHNSQKFQQWCEQWATECLRVLKPGGHLLAFGGTRTWHRLTCAVEDAGFEIRDSIAWLYGSGFPKSLDVSKAIDKLNGKPLDRLREFGTYVRTSREAAGLTAAEVNRMMGTPQGCGWWEGKGVGAKWDLHPPSRATWARLKTVVPTLGNEWDWFVDWCEAEREVIGERTTGIGTGRGSVAYIADSDNRQVTAPATPDAQTWQGWGTALKPAFEPVVVARKPLTGTVAQNVLEHGTGALNIGATRIGPQPGSGGSSRGDSTACTCPELGDAQTTHTPSTLPRVSSGESPAGRSDLPASAPARGSSCRRPQGSPGGCQSSPCSCGERAQSAGEDDQASALLLGDAPEPGGPHGEGTRNPTSRSKTCSHHTAPNVEQGRWPANVVLDEHQAATLDEMSGELTSGKMQPTHTTAGVNGRASAYGADAVGGFTTMETYGDTGGASRFFYVAKADAGERPRIKRKGGSDNATSYGQMKTRECNVCGNRRTNPAGGKQSGKPWPMCGHGDWSWVEQQSAKDEFVAHPTVKPLTLMRWLVRLVTPPGGTVLEPFAGSGTTVEAAILEGFHCIAIEKGEEYLPLIMSRITRQRDPVEAIKLAGEDLGLFGLDGWGA